VSANPATASPSLAAVYARAAGAVPGLPPTAVVAAATRTFHPSLDPREHAQATPRSFHPPPDTQRMVDEIAAVLAVRNLNVTLAAERLPVNGCSLALTKWSKLPKEGHIES
jgi:hypothetical protein